MNLLIILLIAVSITCNILFLSDATGQENYIPSWLKNNAKWWSQGQITDNEFISGIQYLTQKGIIQIPMQNQTLTNTQQTPDWVNNTKEWASGNISNNDFVKTIQFFVQKGTHSKPTDNSITNYTNSLAKTQVLLSDKNLLTMAGNKYANGNIQLGDGKYVTTGPQKGFIYLCHVPPMGRGASGTGPWINGDTWNFLQKPSVSGLVSWPNAVFSDTILGDTRILSGNDLPIGNTTGNFPISPNDAISKYDQNPNSILVQSFTDKLPANPTYSDTPYCMGGEVGIMLSGVPLFDGFDAELRDAQAHEGQDSCNGHPQEKGMYHYHGLSACFKDPNEKTVLGYALDGFPITGPKVSNDKYLTTDDLDECHGITSEIIENGVPVVTYHYVMTYDFPYSASCFRGKPSEYMVISGQNQNTPNQNTSNQGTIQDGQNQNNPRTPPQEAIDACNNKSIGNQCSFTSPHGDQISGTCQIPPNNQLACVPH